MRNYTFDELITIGEKLGIKYSYNQNAKERFSLEYRGKVWTRANPPAIKGLLENIIYKIETNDKQFAKLIEGEI